MLERIPRLLIVALIVCVGLSGCSSFSKTARQEAAYARYVKKFSNGRVKQKKKYAKVKIPKGQMSQNIVNTGATNAPQSVSSSEGQSGN
jgi:hypothetical protein